MDPLPARRTAWFLAAALASGAALAGDDTAEAPRLSAHLRQALRAVTAAISAPAPPPARPAVTTGVRA